MYLKQIFCSFDINPYSIEIDRKVNNLLIACTLVITGKSDPIFTLDIQEECFIKSGIVFLLKIRKGNGTLPETVDESDTKTNK